MYQTLLLGTVEHVVSRVYVKENVSLNINDYWDNLST